MSRVLSRLGDSWFRLLILVSICLVLITFVSYAVQGSIRPRLSELLFLIGLGGENNIGAWWSGMLLLLASVFAFDGFASRRKSDRERRGWLTLSLVLLMLSFDEVASLHEYISSTVRPLLLVPGLLGAAMTLYAFHQLIRAKVEGRIIVSLCIAFALLSTVPVQEAIQHSREWNDPVIYGIRALVEEGAEIAAFLIFVGVTRRNSEDLARVGDSSEALWLTARYRRPLILGAAACLPFLTWATFVLPYPGGPADWLGASLYLFCALHVVRTMLTADCPSAAGALPLLAFYAAASMSANVLKITWDAEILGSTISVRGLGIFALLIAAPVVLRHSGRPASFYWLLPAAVLALIGSVSLAKAQAFLCAFPPALALYMYAVESRYAEGRNVERRAAAFGAPAARA